MIFGTLSGNVGADAELHYSKDGKAPFLSVRVASGRYDGKLKEKVTDWVNVTFFGQRAETLAPMLQKGKTISVNGVIFNREYEGKNGKGVSLECKASEIELIGGRKGEAGDTEPTAVIRAGVTPSLEAPPF